MEEDGGLYTGSNIRGDSGRTCGCVIYRRMEPPRVQRDEGRQHQKQSRKGKSVIRVHGLENNHVCHVI
jgi:hypothetical protein